MSSLWPNDVIDISLPPLDFPFCQLSIIRIFNAWSVLLKWIMWTGHYNTVLYWNINPDYQFNRGLMEKVIRLECLLHCIGLICKSVKTFWKVSKSKKKESWNTYNKTTYSFKLSQNLKETLFPKKNCNILNFCSSGFFFKKSWFPALKV